MVRDVGRHDVASTEAAFGADAAGVALGAAEGGAAEVAAGVKGAAAAECKHIAVRPQLHVAAYEARSECAAYGACCCCCLWDRNCQSCLVGLRRHHEY